MTPRDDQLRVALPTEPAPLAGTDATVSTSLREILAAALPELIEVELTETIGGGQRNALLII